MDSFPSELSERYEPLRFLGDDDLTKVFKARRRKDGKIVILKVLKIHDERAKRILAMEITGAWLQLNHPNIVRLYDVKTLPVLYLETEFVDGQSLDRYPKPTDEKTALKIVMGIAQALKHAHSKGVYHRDLTPSNVLLTKDMTPKVSDWGLSKGVVWLKSTLTQSFTPLHAAPEQLNSKIYGRTDHRTDIWQLGVIFYELVTGELPFKGGSMAKLIDSIMSRNPPKPSELNPKAKIFDEIIMKCLAKRKEDRYQSIDALIEDLKNVSKSQTSLHSTSLYFHTSEQRKLQRSVSNRDEQPHGSTYITEHIIEGFPSSFLTRYEPLEFLGEGGFARVYKARRKSDGKIVALKIPRIDERTSSLFVKEVAAWYNLNHENIVRLYRADILPVPYLEMEFVEGVEIDGKLIRNLGTYPKPVDEKTALKLIRGIAEGLKHAHSKGIHHLDLKPENVLLKADMTPKITDWGLAQISARSSLSRHYGYSPLYAAPEQLDEETYGEPDHRTDIYQIGLILYELLAGELPYRATSPGALVGKILQAKPRPVSELSPELKKFEGMFERLLAKEKEKRYQSVDEFISALDSLKELENEKEELRKTSLAMRRSRSREEFERLKAESVRKTVKIALLSARLNDKAELLAALDDLKFYTNENLDDLLSAIEQVELLIREGIPISAEVEERLRALVLRIEGEFRRV
ncbi:MAG: serine/threonine protein kinase [Thermococci archaeon]|nr:serine/threonine protein kinase [Thermococci archaeon]